MNTINFIRGIELQYHTEEDIVTTELNLSKFRHKYHQIWGNKSFKKTKTCHDSWSDILIQP